MKRIYISVIALFMCAHLFGQDTTIVQTFTWDSETRNDLFNFPTDDTKEYRKILMRYHMRCHDAAVGNGAVGCREWDYSCNTFITDPTTQDSLRSEHPDHIIPGFNELILDYVNTPVYDYYQTALYTTSMEAINPLQTNIGNGTTSLSIQESENIARVFMLVSKDELEANGAVAGDIHGIELYLNNTTTTDRFQIRSSGTTDSTLHLINIQNQNWTSHYHNNHIFNEGANQLPLHTPINWDGTSNIIIELSYTNSQSSSALDFVAHETSQVQTMSSGGQNAAMQCRGTSSVIIPTDKLSSIENEVSVCFWAKGDAERLPSNTFIFNAQDADNGRQISSHLPWSNGQLYWDCGGDRVNASATEDMYEGQWNHYAFVKNAATGEQVLYVNGKEFVKSDVMTQAIKTVTRFILGNEWGYNNSYYGLIDEFQIWDVALDEETINEWMGKSVDSSHPQYDALLSYYTFDEGEGNDVSDQSSQANHTNMQGADWYNMKGEDLYMNFHSSTSRPNLGLLQGEYEINTEINIELDSLAKPQYVIIPYTVEGTDLVQLDPYNVYPAGYSFTYDADGNKIDSIYIQGEDGVGIDDLVYYRKFASKYEILSLVTPYGNGLDLGPEGKVFMFDVSDFEHILTGEKRMSIEMGGQWQEELDIQFHFIEGTPERDVISLQNVWPFTRAWFDQLQNDALFETRTIDLNPDAAFYELRSSITGHGQNGEFVSRQHYVNVNGGDQEYKFNVWKECAFNPIYPQGGTWIFDRAGWCPGMETDLRRLRISDHVDLGETITLDYGVNGAWMDQANYLASHQLVTYGPLNHQLDASIEAIIRPNNERVEFERINPACTGPMLEIRNSGAEEITSLTIEYGVRGNEMYTYEWTGSIEPLTNKEIEMVIYDLGFWDSPNPDEHRFDARILSVNGGQDELSDNNFMSCTFDPVEIFEFEGTLSMRVLTNNVAVDNSYTITDAEGKVVMERDDMDNNTEYLDLLNLASGCYTLNFSDASHDGLYFWFFGGNGAGALSISEELVNDIYVPVKTFLSDHGGGIQYDFVINNELTNTTDIEPNRMSIYPNPVNEELSIEWENIPEGSYQLSLFDLTGAKVHSEKIQLQKDGIHTLRTDAFVSGQYILLLQGAELNWTHKIGIVH